MSGQVCRHEGWGMYSNETGPCPPPAEMKADCVHRQECLVCKSHVFIGCTCPNVPAINYATAIVGNYEKRG